MTDQAEPRGSVKNLQILHPLSIEPILEEIFRSLSIDDLKACASVNDVWKSEADLVMHQINVQISLSVISNREEYILQEIKGLRRESNKYSSDFPHLVSTIKSAMEGTRRPQINLRLNLISDLNCTELVQFLEKFGHLIFRLNYALEKCVSPREFSQFLWKYLPNLVELHMDVFHISSAHLDPLLEEEKKLLEKLKTLTFYQLKPDMKERFESQDCVLAILNMAPNLQIIQGFPLETAHILGKTGKSHLVRTMSIPQLGTVMSGDRMKISLEILSKLKPHLTSFDLPRSPYVCSAKIFRSSKNFLTTILQSSRETLEHLVIFPTERHRFLAYPPGMTGVRILELPNEANQDDLGKKTLHPKWKPRRRFFPPRAKLRKIFPNVNELKISLEEITPNNCSEHFPPKPFQKLPITRLHLNKPAARCLEKLSQVFPLVDHLTINITEMILETLESIVNDISRFIHLKSLQFQINSQRFYYCNFILGLWQKSEQHCFFDSILTGLPEHILSSPTKLENLHLYRTKPSLLEIEGLENVEFIFNNKIFSWYGGEWNFTGLRNHLTSLFSQVSADYGLRIFPHVHVAVRVEEEHACIDSDTMIKAIGAVLEDIELDMSYKP